MLRIQPKRLNMADNKSEVINPKIAILTRISPAKICSAPESKGSAVCMWQNSDQKRLFDVPLPFSFFGSLSVNSKLVFLGFPFIGLYFVFLLF